MTGPREIAFVTGAAQGIGLATVARLARDGFRVVAMDRSGDRLNAEITRLRSEGLDVVAAVADVCDRASVPRRDGSAATRRRDGLRRRHLQRRNLLDLTEAVFRQMLEVNVTGTFIPAQEAARRMLAGGRIVTISSRGALGGTRFAHYVASKAAVIGLTRAMAMELRASRISVNSVAPGFTDTPMTRSAPAEMFSAWEALEPAGKAASPDEIANAIAFFAAPTTTFITGQTLFVDGGKSLGGLTI